MKTCSKCGQPKPLAEFYKRPSGSPRADCRTCCMARHRAWVEQNRDRVREHNRRSEARPEAKIKRAEQDFRERLAAYGLTEADYDRMLAEQGGVCFWCQQPETRIDTRTGKPFRLAVDHDHRCCPSVRRGGQSCGRCIRWLLCAECNILLGRLERRPVRIERLGKVLSQADAAAIPAVAIREDAPCHPRSKGTEAGR